MLFFRFFVLAFCFFTFHFGVFAKVNVGVQSEHKCENLSNPTSAVDRGSYNATAFFLDSEEAVQKRELEGGQDGDSTQ